MKCVSGSMVSITRPAAHNRHGDRYSMELSTVVEFMVVYGQGYCKGTQTKAEERIVFLSTVFGSKT